MEYKSNNIARIHSHTNPHEIQISIGYFTTDLIQLFSPTKYKIQNHLDQQPESIHSGPPQQFPLEYAMFLKIKADVMKGSALHQKQKQLTRKITHDPSNFIREKTHPELAVHKAATGE